MKQIQCRETYCAFLPHLSLQVNLLQKEAWIHFRVMTLSCRKLCHDDDMDLTASEVSKIITVSTGTKKKRKKNPDDCRMKTFKKK